MTERLKEQQKFRDLIAFDLLFFAHWRNREIAAELEMTEATVALLKHRFVRRVAAEVPGLPQDDPDQFVSGALLSQIWEEGRPSCPKRSTLGKFVLGTLDSEWDRYVDFHTSQLGCHYCGANLDDLSQEIERDAADTGNRLRDRILESTVGFLSGPAPT